MTLSTYMNSEGKKDRKLNDSELIVIRKEASVYDIPVDAAMVVSMHNRILFGEKYRSVGVYIFLLSLSLVYTTSFLHSTRIPAFDLSTFHRGGEIKIGNLRVDYDQFCVEECIEQCWYLKF